MAIAVLGPLTISGDGSLAPRDRVVLAALAVRRGELVAPAVLAEALWGEQPPATWAKQIQASIVRLRRALGSGAVETGAEGYRLAVPGDEIDADRFERLVARARDLEALGAWERSAHLLGEALALWRGEPLLELDGWAPGQIEAARLEALRLDAEEAQLEAGLQSGGHRDLVARARVLVAEQPLREYRWEVLARALYLSGQQAEALRTIREARRRLADELGLVPGPALSSLEDSILRHDPSLVAPQRQVDASPICPYRGLVPYDTSDADMFFGRDVAVSACLHRLADHGVLVVAGPSGSGKSSVVRAGVAAALERDGRPVVVITPGADPERSLRDARTSQHGTVLVVDQCEEVFTLCPDHAAQARFLRSLVDHNGPLVVAIRADRLGDVAAHPTFLRVVERGLYLVQPMADTEIRAAIEEPARASGLLLEPGLTDLLVREVEGEPGALPLLSHALAQTWANREGRTLTVAGYVASGGIRGAIAQSAERVYEQAGPRQRPLVRDLMLRLVTPGDEGEPIRSRVARRALATDADHEAVIELLVTARLVTSDDGMVELAHEALTRAWPRLLGWLDDDTDGQRILRHLSIAADGWDAMGRPDAELYRGGRLDRAVDWRDRNTPNLNRTEVAFLEASQRRAESERGATRRRRRSVTAALVVGLALTTSLAGFALVNQRRADHEAERATAAAQRADREADRARGHALASASISMLGEDPSLAALLAVAAATTSTPTPESTAALHQAWAADSVVARHVLGGDVAFARQSTDIDPAGDRMAIAGAFPVNGSGKVLEVVDLNDDSVVWRYDVAEAAGSVATPKFSADGTQVVAGVYWYPNDPRRSPQLARDAVEEPVADLVGARVWDAATGSPGELYDLGRCGGTVSAISSTHMLVRTLHGTPAVVAACDWAQGTMGTELLDRRSERRQVLAADSGSPLCGAAMSDDGRRIAYDSIHRGTHEVVVADTATGDVVRRFELTPGVSACGARALNADGSLLLTGDQPIRVMDVSTGSFVASFAGHRGASRFASFSTTGRTVVSTGADGAMREWDALTGEQVAVHPGVGDGTVSVSSNGFVLVSDAYLQSSLLDTRPRGEVGAVATCRGTAVADGLRVVAGIAAITAICEHGRYPTTHIVDIATQQVVYALPGQGAVAVAADGSRLVQQDVGTGDRAPLVVRDVSSGAELVRLDGAIEGSASRLAWSSDGTMVAAAAGTTIRVWDTSTGSLLFTDADPSRIAITDVIFSPDSTMLFATSNDARARVIATDTWSVVREISGGYAVGLVGFSLDGTQLLAATQFMANSSSALHWFDLGRSRIAQSTPDMAIGSLRSVAISPDGTLLATASSDGRLRIWSAATFELAQEIPLAEAAVQGVAFIDDRHLAVTPQSGDLLFLTLDGDELLEIVRRSLTRGFTEAECARFEFDDHCPTLAELTG